MMYTWEKTHSSGGQELYMRVQVKKICNEDVYSQYRPSERHYNAFSNEWDFCREFHFGSDSEHGYNSDSNDNDYYNNGHLHSAPSKTLTCPSSPQGGPMDMYTDISQSGPMDTDMDTDTDIDMDNIPQPFYSRDVLDTATLVYGYVLPLNDVLATPVKFSWHALLGFLGFVNNLSDLSVSELDQHTMILFFKNLFNGSRIPAHLLDLSNGTFSFSNLFDFSTIHRPSEDLFVFYLPHLTACRWVLGVHSAAAALYTCHYILTNPAAHTLLTVTHHLVERGIPFCTLLPLKCSPRQVSVSQEFIPTSHRLALHTFIVADFKASMLQCQTVLSSPQGRAALLQGGIVAHIAKEYISNDCAYKGPLVEVTSHQVGYLVPSSDGIHLCDDELT